MDQDDDDDLTTFQPEESEPITQRKEHLTGVLLLIADLEKEADFILDTLRNGGFSPANRTKATMALVKINRITRELEESFGMYRHTPWNP